MNFWQFADKTLERIRVEHVAGCGIFMLTIMIFVMIYVSPTLAQDDLFKTLAQVIVVQGLVGLAMAAWFTVKNQKDGEMTIKNDESTPIPTREVDHEQHTNEDH